MKKTFFVIMGAALAVIAVACGSETPMNLETAETHATSIKKVDPASLADETDSLSYYLGFNEGMAVANNRGTLPEDILVNFHLNDYLTGVTAVLKSDTAKLGYTDGIGEGLHLLDVILQYEDGGVEVNRDVLIQAMSARLLGDAVADSVMTADADVLSKLVSRASTIITASKMASEPEE